MLMLTYFENRCRGKFPKHRQIWLQTAVDRMQDKSSQVRTHAIELLTRLIITHPFVMDGGELKLEEFKKRLELIQKEIDVFLSSSLIRLKLTGHGITGRVQGDP